jgi:hypothetical protein
VIAHLLSLRAVYCLYGNTYVNLTAFTLTEAIEDNICDAGLIYLPLPGDLEAIGHGGHGFKVVARF